VGGDRWETDGHSFKPIPGLTKRLPDPGSTVAFIQALVIMPVKYMRAACSKYCQDLCACVIPTRDDLEFRDLMSKV